MTVDLLDVDVRAAGAAVGVAAGPARRHARGDTRPTVVAGSTSAVRQGDAPGERKGPTMSSSSAPTPTAPRGLAAWLLQGLLTTLGLAMSLTSRWTPRFRRQVTRDLVVELGSADGARQQYRFVAATRRMHAPLRREARAEVTLRFGSSREGLRALLSTHTVGRIVEGMNTGDTRIEGNPVLILWFYGMTRVVAPIGSTRRPRRPGRVPVRAPERDAPYAARIVTEPPVRALSAQWPQAWRARATLLHTRAPQGARLPEG